MTGELIREETPGMQKGKGCVRTQQEGMFYKPSREASGKTKPANTLTLDFSLQNSEESSIIFKPPSLWHFVMAVLAN